MKESEVGITEFISTHEGFNGIIKQRYSDFHVSEIDLDGNIAQLKHMLPPEDIESPIKKEHYLLQEVLDQDIIDKLQVLMEHGKPNVEIDVTAISKDNRRKIHKAIQSTFKETLYSNTKAIENKRFMVVSKTSTLSKKEIRTNWPEERGGKYVRFIMLKENLDTNEAISELASVLRLNPACIAYAGTKDKRGVTSQWLSIFKIEPKRLHEASGLLRNIKIGNYCYKQKTLSLGDLKGNRFRIALRNVTGTPEQIEMGMKSLQERGFINYYGMQRFGNSNIVPTHAVGRALLLCDWKLAAELILKPREGESHDITEARRIWWTTRNPHWAFKALRDYDRTIEGKLLSGLQLRGSNNFLDALERIPRNTRLMYLHAYQSLVWNKVTSRRIREFGLKPIEGDLVLIHDGTEENIDRELVEPDKNPDVLEESVSKRTWVRPLAKEDLDKVTIEDIVLPLPGYDIQYPQNEIKDWYEDILSQDGLSTQGLKLNVKKYSLGGDYRKLIIKPKNVIWSLMKYSDPKKNLVLSDFQILQRHEKPKEDSDGQYNALLLEFELPCSTYATMMLREILKMDTSASHQASLNNYHRSKPTNSNKDEIPSLFSVTVTNVQKNSKESSEKNPSPQPSSPPQQQEKQQEEQQSLEQPRSENESSGTEKVSQEISTCNNSNNETSNEIESSASSPSSLNNEPEKDLNKENEKAKKDQIKMEPKELVIKQEPDDMEFIEEVAQPTQQQELKRKGGNQIQGEVKKVKLEK